MPVLRTPLVPDPVSYAVLAHPGEHLPLVLHLHGAGGSEDSLAQREPAWRRAWEQGWFPPAVVACASTPTQGGFYTGAWEQVVADALPARLAQTHGVDLSRVVLLGASMGGYGALKLAFRHPERYLAVAALEPAVLPGESPADVGPRHTLGVLGELFEAIRGAYATEHVVALLRRRAGAVRDSGLAIAFECGDRDCFRLHDGAEYLHRVLWDLEISHDYRLVRGADHVGREAPAREEALMRFLADVLLGPVEDPLADEVRAMMAPFVDAVDDPAVHRRYGILP